MNNKTPKIILIVLLSILVIGLSIFFVNILTNKNFRFGHFSFGHKVSNELVFNQEYEAIFDIIKIDSKSSDIEIKEGNESKVKVVIYGDKDETNVEIVNNKLNIKSNEKKCIGFCFNMTIAKIEVYLPSSYSGNINIENNYGDVNIGNFDNLILDAKLDAGDIKVDSLKSGKIKNSYGDIKILGYSKELEIDQDCGDVEVSEVDRIKLENNYGDINIGKVNEYLQIKEDCGDVKIDSLNLKENSSIHNSYGDIKIGSTNEIYINAKTSLGDTKINNNYQKSYVTLTIDNSCGDIRVNN